METKITLYSDSSAKISLHMDKDVSLRIRKNQSSLFEATLKAKRGVALLRAPQQGMCFEEMLKRTNDIFEVKSRSGTTFRGYCCLD